MANPDAKKILKFLLKAAEDTKVWEEYKKIKDEPAQRAYLTRQGLGQAEIDYCLGGGNTTFASVEIPSSESPPRLRPITPWQPPTVWQ